MKILFMCVANSARSQLAEGLARKLFPRAEIASAGSNPGKLNHYAVSALKEIGIDISMNHSKAVSELPSEFVDGLDFVVTLCAEEMCPMIISKAKRLHWPYPDPATLDSISDQEALNKFRDARDGIRAKLVEFQKEIGK